MRVTREQIEQVMAAHSVTDEWNEVCDAHQIDPEGAGVFCGYLAKEALEQAGVPPSDPLYRKLGAALTTVAVVAFEGALRADDLAQRPEGKS